MSTAHWLTRAREIEERIWFTISIESQQGTAKRGCHAENFACQRELPVHLWRHVAVARLMQLFRGSD